MGPSTQTNEITPASRTYSAHRGRQRRRILDAAEQLFDEQGIGRTTMAQIISATGIQTSTIYQYFANKDEIVWGILGETLARTATRIEAIVNPEATAFERISALLDYMANELETEPATVRFMAQFDAMYARDWPVERLLTIEQQVGDRFPDFLESLVRDGIEDGSLRSDLDPKITMHAVLNTAVGSQRRLASLGNRVEVEYGRTVDAMFRETIRIILLGLQKPGHNVQSM